MSQAGQPCDGRGAAAVYQHVVASLPGLCLAYDLSGNLVAWNDALEVASGYARGELASRAMADLLPGAASDLLAIDSAEADDRGEAEGALQTSLVTRQGLRLPIEATVNALLDGDRVVGGVMVAWDLRAVRRRQEQTIRLERLRALNELASGISHNINNRLTVILGRAQLASKTARGEDLQDDLRATARRSSRRRTRASLQN